MPTRTDQWLQLEESADDFAAAVMWKTSERLWMGWAESASRLDSGWKKLGVMCLVIIGGLVLGIHAEYGARYPKL